jgi:hypothetical protein
MESSGERDVEGGGRKIEKILISHVLC